MNKTFTAALAISAISSLALADRTPATVDTPPAGYAEVSTANAFVLNPFTPFDDALSLGDIEGTQGAKLRLITEKGKKSFDVEWSIRDDGATTGWWDAASSTWKDNFSIGRGISVQFICDDDTLTMAGVVTNGNMAIECHKGYNFVGNVAPVAKPISAFSVSGDYDPFSSSYISVDGVKLVYLNAEQAGWISKDAGWYLKSDIDGAHPENATAQTTSIAAGTGFFAYFTAGGAVINAPGQ